MNDSIAINALYTRSINIERDAGSTDIAKAYIPTPRVLQTLGRIGDAFNKEPMPRSWALVGPYGAGKSAFALFLYHLIGDLSSQATKSAFQVLKKHSAALARTYRGNINGSSGYCRILLTGSPESLSKRLLIKLSDSSKEYWCKRKGRRPSVVDELEHAASLNDVKVSEIIALIGKLQDAISRANGKGLLIIIDELGKFLEYEARHADANDIFLLQAIAEHAQNPRNGNSNLFLVTLLHQSFEQYSKGVSDNVKKEWLKVQGRFENVPFIESAEQILRIISSVFSHKFTKDQAKQIKSEAHTIAKSLSDEGALPFEVSVEEAANIFSSCYPIHPVALLLLPRLCQKVAQNERTLFTYLGSSEPFGLRDSIKKLSSKGKWIGPWEIYDYFVQNQSVVINDQFTHRRWAEVVTALERLGDGNQDDLRILKTIGLFNIAGSHNSFKASGDVLRLVFENRNSVSDALHRMTQKSIIQYRKFNSEYRAWEGSDFDLEAVYAELKGKVGDFEIGDTLNQRSTLLPIVARRHSIESGAVRYFQSLFADSFSFKQLKPKDDKPRIIFFILENPEKESKFRKEALEYFSELDVVCMCSFGSQIREVLIDALVYERILRDYQELQADPIASREIKDRIKTSVEAETEIIQDLIEAPEDCSWFWKGENIPIDSKRQMQEQLSQIFDNIYDQAPKMVNELINREHPSSQAIAARNKLLAALLHENAATKDLGIGKYPAEKGIYRAILKAPGLHREVNKVWRLKAPDNKPDEYNYYPMWCRIEKFFDQTELKAKPLTDLDDVLCAPPYGVKAGVLPIIYIVAYLINQDELALYENREYIPYITAEHVERFVRRPGDFSVQCFRISGVRSELFNEYKKVIYKSDANVKRSVLSLAKPLAKLIADFPEYTKQTKRLSDKAIKIRSAFSLSKSPEQLLFKLLPEACDMPDVCSVKKRKESVSAFTKELVEGLRELKYALEGLIKRQQKMICIALRMDPKSKLKDLRADIKGRYQGLEDYTIEIDGLKAFIVRLINPKGEDEAWLKGILSFLGRKPVGKWSDLDSGLAEYRLKEYSSKINDLEKLRVYHEQNGKRRSEDHDFILLRSIRKGKEEKEEIACLDRKTIKVVEKAKDALKEEVEKLGDRDLQLSVIAEFVDEFLANKDEAPGHKHDESVQAEKKVKKMRKL